MSDSERNLPEAPAAAAKPNKKRATNNHLISRLLTALTPATFYLWSKVTALALTTFYLRSKVTALTPATFYLWSKVTALAPATFYRWSKDSALYSETERICKTTAEYGNKKRDSSESPWEPLIRLELTTCALRMRCSTD